MQVAEHARPTPYIPDVFYTSVAEDRAIVVTVMNLDAATKKAAGKAPAASENTLNGFPVFKPSHGHREGHAV